ncbi:hypothetical protein [Acinetobacter gerneri]|uniref:hypothetical protein n=1 Tax=Acinetobacter gerneri TaxID=202952 RepID=UPI003A89E3EC
MRKTNIISLMAACILLSSGLLHAEPSSNTPNDKEELCKAASYFASVTFEGYQNGEKKKDYLEIVDEMTDIPSSKKDYFKKLVNEVFSKPLYSSKEEKSDAVQKINKDIYADCMKKESSAPK